MKQRHKIVNSAKSKKTKKDDKVHFQSVQSIHCFGPQGTREARGLKRGIDTISSIEVSRLYINLLLNIRVSQKI